MIDDHHYIISYHIMIHPKEISIHQTMEAENLLTTNANHLKIRETNNKTHTPHPLLTKCILPSSSLGGRRSNRASRTRNHVDALLNNS